ncbi:transposase [Hydrogenophaga sp. BPS33]|uniref:transposase n=1 Tax=Hydrogenophaga sp. BPS33 TaxID=2651974 RepID=UPI0013204946|nr:transposase [Hydrogenophaga sp. BPS33]QHE87993.1 transposase [Hydrogenophaga sp. BPS33]
MARLPRLTVPGYPHHVIQRGNNRQDIFRSDADREVMLDLISENARKHQVAFNAYVLMDNHFHLLLTPETAQGVPLTMQAVGRRYVRYFNDLYHRTGTLWEGRYKSTLVQTERYLLACMVYIDLNPVRAGMVSDPKSHRWSSHGHYVGQTPDRRIVPPASYWALGNTPFAREAAYTELVREGQSAAQQRAITDATLHGWALGGPEFSAELQKRTPRRTTRAAPGRPPSLPVEG